MAQEIQMTVMDSPMFDYVVLFFSSEIAPIIEETFVAQKVRILLNWDSIFHQNTLFHQTRIVMNNMHDIKWL